MPVYTSPVCTMDNLAIWLYAKQVFLPGEFLSHAFGGSPSDLAVPERTEVHALKQSAVRVHLGLSGCNSSTMYNSQNIWASVRYILQKLINTQRLSNFSKPVDRHTHMLFLF